jgi:hypothetical protein
VAGSLLEDIKLVLPDTDCIENWLMEIMVELDCVVRGDFVQEVFGVVEAPDTEVVPGTLILEDGIVVDESVVVKLVVLLFVQLLVAVVAGSLLEDIKLVLPDTDCIENWLTEIMVELDCVVWGDFVQEVFGVVEAPDTEVVPDTLILEDGIVVDEGVMVKLIVVVAGSLLEDIKLVLPDTDCIENWLMEIMVELDCVVWGDFVQEVFGVVEAPDTEVVPGTLILEDGIVVNEGVMVKLVAVVVGLLLENIKLVLPDTDCIENWPMELVVELEGMFDE